MDAIKNIFSDIGGFFTNSPSGGWSGGPNWGNIGKTVGGLGLGEQFIANWLQNRKQNDYLNKQIYYQTHPQAMQNEITGLTQPLDQNLVASVTNQVQGNLGAQGLSQSPNITASVLAQALAPYAQQNQQLAAQEWANLHGIPIQFPQQANMMPLWRWLMGRSNPNATMLPENTSLPTLDSIFFPPSGGGGDSTGAGDLFNWGDLGIGAQAA